MYRLRAKVEIAERPELGVAAVFGDGALPALGLPDEPGAVRPVQEGSHWSIRGWPSSGLASSRTACVWPAFAETGLTEADFAAYDRHRLALGVPDGSRDLVPEKSILLESGFDELNGVDWQKGCYVGQELTARTKYRGLIKKRLFPVRIDRPGSRARHDGDAGRQGGRRDALGPRRSRARAAAAGGRRRKPPLSPPRMRASMPYRPPWMHIAGSENR